MHSPLRNIDLNLLVVFDALYRHRSVTLAANEVALSPSAFSHALNRLRYSLGDPLFLRQGSRMHPTPRAEKIAVGVAIALSGIHSCLADEDEFDPALSQYSFTFAVTDYTAAVFLPRLLSRVLKVAPNIRFNVVYSKMYDSIEDLTLGKVDFAVGFEDKAGITRQDIEVIDSFTDDYVVAVNKAHSTIRQGLTKKEYLAAKHVVVNPWNEPLGTIDRYLENQNLRRNISVELPSLLPALQIVANTDLIITLPRRSLNSIIDIRHINTFPSPLPMPEYTIKFYFNPTHCTDNAHRWLINEVKAMSWNIGDHP